MSKRFKILQMKHYVFSPKTLEKKLKIISRMNSWKSSQEPFLPEKLELAWKFSI